MASKILSDSVCDIRILMLSSGCLLIKKIHIPFTFLHAAPCVPPCNFDTAVPQDIRQFYQVPCDPVKIDRKEMSQVMGKDFFGINT